MLQLYNETGHEKWTHNQVEILEIWRKRQDPPKLLVTHLKHETQSLKLEYILSKLQENHSKSQKRSFCVILCKKAEYMCLTIGNN